LLHVISCCQSIITSAADGFSELTDELKKKLAKQLTVLNKLTPLMTAEINQHPTLTMTTSSHLQASLSPGELQQWDDSQTPIDSSVAKTEAKDDRNDIEQ